MVVVMVMVSVVVVAVVAIVAIEILMIVAAVVMIIMIVPAIGIHPPSSPFIIPSWSPIIQRIIQPNMVVVVAITKSLLVPFLPLNLNLELKLGIGYELEIGMEIVRMGTDDCAG